MLTLAYDGTAYCGWQRQVDKPTVQAALEAAIAKVTRQTPKTLASGRTDAGVHALRQVVRVQVDTSATVEVLLRALSASLPRDLAALELVEIEGGFHPIGDAIGKCYRYVICDGPAPDVFTRHYCWHYRYGRLDAVAMRRAAEGLLGRHDFRSFASSGSPRKTTVRTLQRLSVERVACHPIGWQANPTAQDDSEQGRGGQGGAGDWIVIEAAADGFLYNMVRAIVGSLVEVGRGARSETWPTEALEAQDRCRAGPTAPPQGLFLANVWYRPGIEIKQTPQIDGNGVR